MKRIIFSLIFVLTFIGIALRVSSAMADDGRSHDDRRACLCQVIQFHAGVSDFVCFVF